MSDDRDQRIADLESQIVFLSTRHSALEWVVEQHFAHYLLSRDDAERFLNGIASRRGAYQKEAEGFERPTRPDRAQLLYADIERIVEKIRARVREGVRFRPT